MNWATKTQMSEEWEKRKLWDWSKSNCELGREHGHPASAIRYMRIQLCLPKFQVFPKQKQLGVNRATSQKPPIGISKMEAEELERRFWDKVERHGDDECWPWIGHRDKQGYGRLFTWSSKGTRTQRAAHRIAYAITNGGVPENLLVMHSCDNKWCCNPNHLSIGTDLDNSRDASMKGRMHPGERTFGAILTEEIVKEIGRLSKSGIGSNQIGRNLKIHRKTVADVVNRKTWRHVVW